MALEESMGYCKLKVTLLKLYEFKKILFGILEMSDLKLEKSFQSVAYLQYYFIRWIGMAKCEHKF